jgi:hypothetical protein
VAGTRATNGKPLEILFKIKDLQGFRVRWGG